jgi:hypothetical protein
MENSFGRKIKNNFSITFKKDEEAIKMHLNEQISPSAYIKRLILEDMRKGTGIVDNKTNIISSNKEEESFDIKSFDFDLE